MFSYIKVFKALSPESYMDLVETQINVVNWSKDFFSATTMPLTLKSVIDRIFTWKYHMNGHDSYVVWC